MSGIEIAGLILGIVPVTVAALKQFKTAHELGHRITNTSAYIDQLTQKLEAQKFFLELEFRSLLRAVGFEQHGIDGTSGEELQKILSRNDVAEEVRLYLGHGYSLYHNELARCESSLRDLQKSIGAVMTESPSDNSKMGKYNPMKRIKRIKLSSMRDRFDKQISDFGNATETLEKLREKSVPLQDDGTWSSSRTITKFALFLHEIQRHANTLYKAIGQKLASGCHHEHGTRLYLEDQSAVLQKRPLAINFKLAIEAPATPRTKGILRHEVHVEVLKEHTAGPHSRLRSEQSRVRFELPDVPETQDPLMTEVENLCLSLSHARQNNKVLKVFLSRLGCLCSRHSPQTSEGDISSGESAYELVTLDEILFQTRNDRPSRVKWNLIQRMNLSFTLASSILQLCSTPWLSEPWTKQTICFRRLKPSQEAKDLALTFEPDRPFIVHNFLRLPQVDYHAR